MRISIDKKSNHRFSTGDDLSPTSDIMYLNDKFVENTIDRTFQSFNQVLESFEKN